ncbi:hypothetical protein ADK55_23560 [Streptomyces sp. WM4235]|uniref:hypothetical protein n=1 Tax=Streptomyces sp. WM4235 TaxID=1415551 RepID=UPI0006AFFBEB|nr:hypothetical protein [Streptomyces sp. WM4235]KOU43488.1 hypothetical protein ADK55_23560 [Streptomyces sp. WM4235]
MAATLVDAAARIRTLLHTLVAQYVRATKARRVVLVTGHGGNRGVLAALVHELRHTHDISVCALHPWPWPTSPPVTGPKSTPASTRRRSCSTSHPNGFGSDSTRAAGKYPAKSRDFQFVIENLVAHAVTAGYGDHRVKRRP